jgi:hypothetical protein
MIGWLLIAGGVFCLVMGALPLPAFLLGFMIGGWAGRLVYFSFGAVQGWIGIGLLRLKPRARIAAMAWLVFGIVSTLLFRFLPGYPDRLAASMVMLPADLQKNYQYPVLDPGIQILLSTLVCLLPLWFLVRERRAFDGQQRSTFP